MSLGLIFDIRQFWIGLSWHSETKRLIVMILPGAGVVIDFDERPRLVLKK